MTPGALLDEEHLRGGEPNYLVALVVGDRGQAIVDEPRVAQPARAAGPEQGEATKPKGRRAATSPREPLAASIAALDISSSEFVVMGCRRPMICGPSSRD